MRSAVAQVREQLRSDPDLPLETVKKALDLKSYRARMAGDDKNAAAFAETP
jgi:hypothetical protein